MSDSTPISQPSVEFDRIASVVEVAKYFKTTPPTVRKFIDSGRLGAINFGTPKQKLWRIPWSEVLRFSESECAITKETSQGK